MKSRGFALIEMLIAVTITLLLAGAVAGAAPAARLAFERVPAQLEMQQRARTAIDVLSQAMRAADRIMPAIPDDDGGYSELTTVVLAANPAHGVLSIDQSEPGDAMTLAPSPCVNAKDVCGFVVGASVKVTGADGVFDVFRIAAAQIAARRLIADQALSRAYAAGSALIEVEKFTFRLDRQADGSQSLIRVTGAGAIQPVVDFVSHVAFRIVGNHASVELTIQAPTDGLRGVIAERTFRTSIDVRNVS